MGTIYAVLPGRVSPVFAITDQPYFPAAPA